MSLLRIFLRNRRVRRSVSVFGVYVFSVFMGEEKRKIEIERKRERNNKVSKNLEVGDVAEKLRRMPSGDPAFADLPL